MSAGSGGGFLLRPGIAAMVLSDATYCRAMGFRAPARDALSSPKRSLMDPGVGENSPAWDTAALSSESYIWCAPSRRIYAFESALLN